MKKALGQTVRDLKREVNKKVLKLPSIEQKVLDSTSNESWGPHGSSLADIAQATRNYHEYQIIMSIIWKRINDTGKNWRHVYKALTVLEYLVANGSERVIDEIREHAYQISTLSDFQYIDSGGRDQGINVRKKSQSLVVLVNDKERIQEVREKAAANREKYRNTSMGGGMYKPGSCPGIGGYGDRYDDEHHEGHYRGRDEGRNGYGQERDWAAREDDRTGKYGESNSCDGDRRGREYEGRYSRDGYRDEDSRGRSLSVDDYTYVPRSRSSDIDRDHSYEDNGQYSSRGSVGKADGSQDGSVAGTQNDRKHPEQIPAAPPSYEEAVGETGSPAHSERNEVTSTASAPKSSSPPLSTGHQKIATTNSLSAPPPTVPAWEAKEFGGFDEFDPRGSLTSAPLSSSNSEADLFVSSTDPYNLNFLAIVPTAAVTATSEAVAFTNSDSGNGFLSNTTASDQPFEDPFGDDPFRAISSSENFPAQQQNVSTSSFFSSLNQSEPHQPTSQDNNFGFGETDILADILAPSESLSSGFSPQTVHPASQTGFATQTKEPKIVFQGAMNQSASMTGFQAQQGQPSSQDSFPVQVTHLSSMRGYQEQAGPSQVANFPHQGGQYSSFSDFPSQASIGQPAGFFPSHPVSNYNVNFNQQLGSTASTVDSMSTQNPSGPPGQYSHTNFISQSVPQISSQMQAGLSAHIISASPISTNSLAVEPQAAKDKFETKSTIWKDTLNRGIVNLNISGSKTNPLADIGVDFDAINRKERRMEKASQNPVVSTVAMGRAMGSGTGTGRAGAGALRGASNSMAASGMHIGMGSIPGAGMGMGGSRGAGIGMGMGGVPGVGMGSGLGAGLGMRIPMGGGYGVNQPVGGMGMGMNMGMGQGVQMQQPTGFSQVPAIPGAYNPLMGTGNYGNQPYSGGYQ